jgi:DNA repair protein SbcC/Rad50
MEQRQLAHAQALFERSLTRFFSALVDDPALVARTDVAFTPAVAIEGEWTPAEALSGGERTSLALAYRLALAEVVRSLGHLKLDTLLLDEPTDGFSPEQVVRMGELLDALALPQVVLVSHEEALAGAADRVIRIVKEDGRSRLRGGTRDTDASEEPRAAEGPLPPAPPA